MDQQLHSFEAKVQTLDDRNLVEQVGQLFHREKRIGDAILLGLKEIKIRRIYAAMGYSSLFEMLVKVDQLSETASYQRVNALKLMASVPEAQEALLNGDVSVSNAAMVQSFIQRSEKEAQTPMSVEEKKEILESIKGKTHKEAQVILAEINPLAALPGNKEKPLSKNHIQLQIVVDQETIALLKEVQELLSHTIPDGDYNAVLKYMGTQTTEMLRKKKGHIPPQVTLSKEKINHEEKMTTDASKRRVQSRYISRETRRIVYARAEGKCEFIGSNGHRCESRHQVEIDHIKPWSHGGSNDESNCRLLCKTHNLYRVKETHGYWYEAPNLDG